MSMLAFAEAAELPIDDHPDDAANRPTRRGRAWSAEGRLRAWRHGHGYTSEVAGRLWGVTGSAVRQWERESNPVPAHVRVYLMLHPAPPTCQDFPPTPEGLRRAVGQWPSAVAWCRWWGPTKYPTLWRWLNGQHAIPIAVRGWLQAGAPLTWGGRPAPTSAFAPPPIGPAQPVPADWIHLMGQGYAPPCGYCDPERDALQLPGCSWCCYRADCADLEGESHGR